MVSRPQYSTCGSGGGGRAGAREGVRRGSSETGRAGHQPAQAPGGGCDVHATWTHQHARPSAHLVPRDVASSQHGHAGAGVVQQVDQSVRVRGARRRRRE